MKIVSYDFPKSSFLSVEKDLNIITDLMLKNDRLKKLLYYTTPDALKKEALTQEQSLSLLQKNIRIIPKVFVDSEVLTYVIISFDNFLTNETNPEFRDNTISFDIICHFDQWNLGDFQLRPYRIAAEIDSMLDNKKLTGIGTLQFVGANQMILTDEFAGLSLMYNAIHCDEDKRKTLNPYEQIDQDKNYDKIFNNKQTW